MTSSRLPGKIIKDFSNDLNMLDMQLKTLLKIFDKDCIYIATTTNTEDDVIEKKYKSQCNIYRGSEDDVLSRFLEIIKITNATNIIRIASDNPFILYEGIEVLLKYHIENNSDYTTFKIEDIPAMLVPSGLYVEIVSSKALLEVKTKANDIEKEHVTFALYNRLKNNYKVSLIDISTVYSFLNNKDLRFTVDTKEDFEFINNIIKELKIQNLNINIIKKIVSYTIDKNLLNYMIEESNKKRNSKNYDE
jgi:spore coat polysaccharide biosynthesis protein SpsF (cytidylyltransferase family)